MAETIPAQICAWLLARRGERSQAEFATELGIGKTTLARYEVGERVPPFHLVVDWADRYPDFPGRLAPVKGRHATPKGSHVSEDRPAYGADDPVLQMRQNVKRTEAARLQVFALFQSFGLTAGAHRSFRDALLTILTHEDMSPFALTTLVSWYAADRDVELPGDEA